MAFLIVLAVFLLFAVGIPRLSGAGGRKRVLAAGVPARGLVLRAASTATWTLVNGQRLQTRQVTLDVEPQGGAPYEVSLAAIFPRMCESFPGTALDLRVDPKNRQQVAIVGPAGSSAWIGAAQWLPAMGAPSAVQSGCGIAFVVLVSLFLAAGAAISLLAGSESHHSEPAEPTHTEPTHAEPTHEPHVVPEPTHAPTHAPAHAPSASTAVPAECAAATRCCTTLGQPHAQCAAFSKMSAATCASALAGLTQAATQAGKKCH